MFGTSASKPTTDQTFAVARAIGHLEAERDLHAHRPDMEDTIALINSIIDDLYSAFPTLTHLRKDQP